MKKMNTKDMALLIGASAVSMLAGMIVGCIKEKMKLDSYCVIEEM